MGELILVDDNDDFRNVLAEFLRMDGHVVHVAADGPAAQGARRLAKAVDHHLRPQRRWQNCPPSTRECRPHASNSHNGDRSQR
jgi:hypothetical protein